jgi:hypothetical protein
LSREPFGGPGFRDAQSIKGQKVRFQGCRLL